MVWLGPTLPITGVPPQNPRPDPLNWAPVPKRKLAGSVIETSSPRYWRYLADQLKPTYDMDLRMVALLRWFPRDMSDEDLWYLAQRERTNRHGMPGGLPFLPSITYR